MTYADLKKKYLELDPGVSDLDDLMAETLEALRECEKQERDSWKLYLRERARFEAACVDYDINRKDYESVKEIYSA